jgi:hypothetical protein
MGFSEYVLLSLSFNREKLPKQATFQSTIRLPPRGNRTVLKSALFFFEKTMPASISRLL